MENEELRMGVDPAEEGSTDTTHLAMVESNGTTHLRFTVDFKRLPPEHQHSWVVYDGEWYDLGGEG